MSKESSRITLKLGDFKTMGDKIEYSKIVCYLGYDGLIFYVGIGRLNSWNSAYSPFFTLRLFRGSEFVIGEKLYKMVSENEKEIVIEKVEVK